MLRFLITLAFMVASALGAIGGQYSSKCYACEFDSKNCPVLADCPQNRDYCTVGKFDPWTVQQVECPGGCETFLVTDPTGNIVKWRRGCSQTPVQIGSTNTNICITEYNFGIRIDKCTCNGYLCNGGHTRAAQVSVLSTVLFCILSLFLVR